MKNKKILQLIFALVLLIGLCLMMFNVTRAFGLLLTCVLQPLIGLYYLSVFQKEETNANIDKLIFRYPLLFSIQATFIGLVIQRLFSIMQWPFAGPIKVCACALSCITLVLGLFYVVLNRKRIQSIFVIEFVLISMPVLMFIGIFMPKNYSNVEYANVLNKEYIDLCKIEKTLYQQAQRDTSIDLTQVNILQEMKERTEVNWGGVNDKNEVIGALKKIDENENRFIVQKSNSDSLYAIINKEPTSVIEYLNRLTKLQIDLLLKEKK